MELICMAASYARIDVGLYSYAPVKDCMKEGISYGSLDPLDVQRFDTWATNHSTAGAATSIDAAVLVKKATWSGVRSLHPGNEFNCSSFRRGELMRQLCVPVHCVVDTSGQSRHCQRLVRICTGIWFVDWHEHPDEQQKNPGFKEMKRWSKLSPVATLSVERTGPWIMFVFNALF